MFTILNRIEGKKKIKHENNIIKTNKRKTIKIKIKKKKNKQNIIQKNEANILIN